MHNRAVERNEINSIYYIELNYTHIPKGRVSCEDGKYIVRVGAWVSGLNMERFTEIIQDEFNLPDSFELVVDERWNLGKDWPEKSNEI